MKHVLISVAAIGLSLASVFVHANEWIEVKGGAWSPSTEMISEISASIEHFVKKEAKRQGRELRPWDSYRFQYRGYVERGRQFVRIYALCFVAGETSHDAESLSSDFYEVFDGGSCYFGVTYDAKKSRFSHLRINYPR